MAARQLVRVPTVLRAIPTAASASPFTAQWTRSYATPSGPPPKNFRLQPPKEWDQEQEGALDKAGKYFLLTEMARGMYVLLEQFFRPPYVLLWAPKCVLWRKVGLWVSGADSLCLDRYTIYYPFEKVR
jgi:NADH dehydrogenase (ubiquinone) Fe-S protein 8